MILKTSDGRSFSLHVECYEFPNEALGPTDDNPDDEFDTGRFLVVRASFCNPDGSWMASGPEMNTVELERLADWLDSILKGEPSRNGVYFTERDLEFTVDDGKGMLSVHAFRDFLPPWITDRSSTIKISFPLIEIDLKAAILSLRSQLRAFPGRPQLDDFH